MGLSEDDKEYIRNLLEPLAKCEQFDQFKDSIIEKLVEQDKKIEEIAGELNIQKKRIDILEADNILKTKTIEYLKSKSDQNESYSRRHSVRIHHIPVNQNESKQDIMDTVKECCTALKIPFDEKTVSRAH